MQTFIESATTSRQKLHWNLDFIYCRENPGQNKPMTHGIASSAEISYYKVDRKSS